MKTLLPAHLPLKTKRMERELRIGNFLSDDKGRLCMVEQISKDSYYAPAVNGAITSLPNKPIPLTEHWLRNLGFIYDEDLLMFVQRFDIRKTIGVQIRKETGQVDIYFESDVGCGMDGLENSFSNLNQHVHSFQNLIFELTGEELTINGK